MHVYESNKLRLRYKMGEEPKLKSKFADVPNVGSR